MMLNRNGKGVALLAVLGLVSVLVMMLGALIGTNRSTFSLLRFSQTKNRMDRTVSSLYAYAKFRLEHDYRWGQDPFAGEVRDYQGLVLTEVPDGTGPGHIRTLAGNDGPNKTQFVVEICNNLTGEVALIEDTQTGHIDGVPVGFCRVKITVESAGKLEGATILVRNPGLIGASLLANGDLALDADSFQMLTKDPIKNQARSMSDTRITGMDQFLFEGAGSGAPPLGPGVDDANPIVWSGGQAQFRADETATYQDRDSFKSANGGREFEDEKFVDQAQTQFEIPDVGLGDIAEVTGPRGAAKATQRVPSGIYEFQQFSTSQGTLVRVLVRRSTDTQTPLRDQSGPINRFWYTTEDGPAVSPAAVARFVGAPGSATGTHESRSARYVDLNRGGGLKVDLLQRRIVMDDQYNYEIDGDFGIRSGGDLANRIKPSLYFADPDSLGHQNFQYSEDMEEAEVEGRRAHRGSLKATGQIQLDGDISGSATIAGGGDVSLAPTRFYDGNGNTAVDFSIFSGGDISLVPPDLIENKDNRDGNASDIARTIILDDGTEFHIEHANISQNELVFTGLLYAQGSVSFDLRDTADEVQKRDMTIEGAVVARNGDLIVRNAENFDITYNPQYVDRLLPSLFQNGQHRIEVTGWRSFTPTAFTSR